MNNAEILDQRLCRVCGYLVEDHDIVSIARACAALARTRSGIVRDEYLRSNDYDTHPDDEPQDPEA